MGFYNVCAGLRIKVKKEGVKRVIMVSHDGPVAGRAKVAFDGEGRPAVQEIIDGSNTIILEAADGESLIPGENYYFVLYPHKFTDKVFTLTFETDSETGSYVRTKPITFTRSVFEHFNLPVDNNVTYEPLTGIIRTPEQLVSFLQSGDASAAAGDKTIIDADIDLSGYQPLPSAASFARSVMVKILTCTGASHAGNAPIVSSIRYAMNRSREPRIARCRTTGVRSLPSLSI